MEKHDVVIIGGGIAGLTCAKYLDLANVDYVIVSKLLGGNLFNATTIYNFPTYEKIEGSILATQMVEATNIEKVLFDTVQRLLINYDPDNTNKYHLVIGESGEKYEGKAIVIATGSNPVRLNVDAPEGCVNYCAICDAYRYKNKDVIVLGGSESAVQTALYLSAICKSVTIAFRKHELKTTEYSKRLLIQKDNIFLMPNREIKSIEKNNDSFAFTFNNVGEIENNATTTVIADGCFVCWGNKPATDFLDGNEILMENGFISHGSTKRYTETNNAGVFCCGDCMENVYHQLSVAAGNGATCALDVIDYLKRSN